MSFKFPKGFKSKAQLQLGHIRPEVRGFLDSYSARTMPWKDYYDFRQEHGMNSWEQDQVVSKLDDNALVEYSRLIAAHCSPSSNPGRPALTYNESAIHVLLPEFMRRLAKISNSKVPDSFRGRWQDQIEYLIDFARKQGFKVKRVLVNHKIAFGYLGISPNRLGNSCWVFQGPKEDYPIEETSGDSYVEVDLRGKKVEPSFLMDGYLELQVDPGQILGRLFYRGP